MGFHAACGGDAGTDESNVDEQTPAQTDVGCGGSQSPPCVNGKKCKVHADCASRSCKAGVCIAATATDGIKNGDETDVDCGGAASPKCADGKNCKNGANCASRVCSSAGKCTTHVADGVKNGDETDVDCGGSVSPKCADGKKCSVGTDCTSLVCTGNVCQVPTYTDGVKNGTETDVDCGGSGSPAQGCATAQSCVVQTDCKSQGCNDLGKCAEGRSCIALHGGRTCGAGEFGAPGAQHEDCCTTVGMPNAPGGPIRMGKYLVTAGRMRAFLESINGKVRDYVTNNPPADWNPAWTQYLPNSWDGRELVGGTYQVPAGEHPNIYSTYAQVGGAVMEDLPVDQGCFIGGSYGHPTFLVPDGVHMKDGRSTNGAAQIYGETYPRWMTQANLDQRPLNCTPYTLFAAFCAWDGGRVATEAQLNYAYDDDGTGAVSNYPWGATPQAGGYFTVNGAWTKIGPATTGFSNVPCPTCDDTRINWRFNYQQIVPPAGQGGRDQSYFISAPGRFPLGASRVFNNDPKQRIQDISGLGIAITSTLLTTTTHTLTFGNADPSDDRTVTMQNVRWVGGSWEGHPVRGTYTYGALVKYGKAMARCVYP
ncbi:MAG: hypothetical protein U0174_11140 [Polyangiaceae bacterium]